MPRKCTYETYVPCLKAYADLYGIKRLAQQIINPSVGFTRNSKENIWEFSVH